MTLRVAAGQAAAVNGDVRANVATAVRLVELARSQQVRVLLLPEAFLTGYDHAAFDGPVPSADDLDGSWLQPLRAAAAAAGTVVVLSTPLRRGDTTRLSMLVIRDNDSVAAPYDKQHLDVTERPWFTAGDHGASIEVDGFGLGLAICYDSRFPEHAAASAAAGDVAYLASAAYFAGSTRGRDVALPARALDNGMYVVVAAALGTCSGDRLVGGSAVHDPEGHVIAQLADEEGLAIADLDLDAVAEVRSRQPMGAERRADLGARTLG